VVKTKFCAVFFSNTSALYLDTIPTQYSSRYSAQLLAAMLRTETSSPQWKIVYFGATRQINDDFDSTDKQEFLANNTKEIRDVVDNNIPEIIRIAKGDLLRLNYLAR